MPSYVFILSMYDERGAMMGPVIATCNRSYLPYLLTKYFGARGRESQEGLAKILSMPDDELCWQEIPGGVGTILPSGAVQLTNNWRCGEHALTSYYGPQLSVFRLEQG